MQSAATELQSGQRLDRYVIEGKLGEGANGVVYAARDPELDRAVAIKVLVRRGRVWREGQALARVSHPNVVMVHDVGTCDGGVFIAMELVRGATLAAWLARGPSTSEICERLVEAGRGLASVHAAGLVHRDFKPDNVLVGDDGHARVTDFGLARLDGDDDAGGEASGAGIEQTRESSVIGTPAYAAPEQLRGARVDQRADVFAFCVTAYEALCGARPFAGETVPQLLASAHAGMPPRRKLSPLVHDALVRGLAFDPEARTSTIDEVLAALSPRSKRRRWPFAVAAVGVLAAAGVAIYVKRPRAVSTTCDARAELAGVWDAKIAQAARFVGDAAQKRDRMEQYTKKWVQLRDQVCRDHNTKEYESRTWCLDETKTQLGSLGRVFAQQDIDDATFAVLLDKNLTAIDICTSWHGDTATAPPYELIAKVGAARQRIIDARISMTLGRLGDARAIATAIDDAGFSPVRAETAALRADIADAAGDPDEAVTYLRQAISVAETTSYDRVKMESASKLATILARQGKLDEAQSMVELADAMFDRGGSDIVIAIANANTRARLADLRGNTDEAIRMYQATLARYAKLDVPLALLLAQYELYGVYVRVGKNQEAIDLLAQITSTLRANKLELVDLGERCTSTMLTGDVARAVDICRTEMAAHTGTATMQQASRVRGYATALELAGDMAGARDMYLRTAALFEELAQPVEAAFSLEAAGRAALELGDDARAVTLLEKSVALAGTSPEQRMFSAAALARAKVGVGRHVEAIADLERVVPELEAARSRNALATARLSLAKALWLRGADGDRARARDQAKAGREDAIAWRDKFDESGINALYRRRMNVVIGRIDAWLAAHPGT